MSSYNINAIKNQSIVQLTFRWIQEFAQSTDWSFICCKKKNNIIKHSYYNFIMNPSRTVKDIPLIQTLSVCPNTIIIKRSRDWYIQACLWNGYTGTSLIRKYIIASYNYHRNREAQLTTHAVNTVYSFVILTIIYHTMRFHIEWRSSRSRHKCTNNDKKSNHCQLHDATRSCLVGKDVELIFLITIGYNGMMKSGWRLKSHQTRCFRLQFLKLCWSQFNRRFYTFTDTTDYCVFDISVIMILI